MKHDKEEVAENILMIVARQLGDVSWEELKNARPEILNALESYAEKRVEEIRKVAEKYFGGIAERKSMYYYADDANKDIAEFMKALNNQEERRLDQVNRVEVINHTVPIEKGGGRAYVFWEDNVSVTTAIQDKGRTLKVFINNQDEQ